MILRTVTKVLQAIHYGSGWLLDAIDVRDRWYDRPSIRQPIEVIPMHGLGASYQVGNSCTARVVHAFRIAEHNAGRKVPALSALYNYYGSRSMRGTQDRDVGSTVRDAIKSLVKHGAPTEENWPELWGKVNTRPSLRATQAATARGVRGYYRISNGDVTSIRFALAEGYPVIAGWDLSDAFTKAKGRVTSALTGYDFGHAMILDGYAKNGDFYLLNSWRGWGDASRAFASEDFVAAAKDVWVLKT